MKSDIQETDNLEEDDARPFGTTRSYWLQRQDMLLASLLKLLTDSGTQLHEMCVCYEGSSTEQFRLSGQALPCARTA